MRRLVFALALSLIHAAPSVAASYTFTTLDVPGADSTVVAGINDVGQFVGIFSDSVGIHGFFLNGLCGTFTGIDVPGEPFTGALGINNTGQIVGGFGADADFLEAGRGFYLSGIGGRFTTIDVPIADSTTAVGINNAGQIVGYFKPQHRGFFLDALGGTFTDIAVPGATDTHLVGGINDAGEIVGAWCAAPACETGTGSHGFHLSGIEGTFTTIDVPDASQTQAFRINNTGQIVGEFEDAAGVPHGFLKDGSAYTTLDVPGAVSTSILGINNTGQIVGYFEDATGSVHGFVATTATNSDLIARVGALNLGAGEKNSLTAKLQAAQRSLARGNCTATSNQLRAFINEVTALQQSNRLDVSTANSLIIEAQTIISGL